MSVLEDLKNLKMAIDNSIWKSAYYANYDYSSKWTKAIPLEDVVVVDIISLLMYMYENQFSDEDIKSVFFKVAAFFSYDITDESEIYNFIIDNNTYSSEYVMNGSILFDFISQNDKCMIEYNVAHSYSFDSLTLEFIDFALKVTKQFLISNNIYNADTERELYLYLKNRFNVIKDWACVKWTRWEWSQDTHFSDFNTDLYQDKKYKKNEQFEQKVMRMAWIAQIYYDTVYLSQFYPLFKNEIPTDKEILIIKKVLDRNRVSYLDDFAFDFSSDPYFYDFCYMDTLNDLTKIMICDARDTRFGNAIHDNYIFDEFCVDNHWYSLSDKLTIPQINSLVKYLNSIDITVARDTISAEEYRTLVINELIKAGNNEGIIERKTLRDYFYFAIDFDEMENIVDKLSKNGIKIVGDEPFDFGYKQLNNDTLLFLTGRIVAYLEENQRDSISEYEIRDFLKYYIYDDADFYRITLGLEKQKIEVALINMNTIDSIEREKRKHLFLQKITTIIEKSKHKCNTLEIDEIKEEFEELCPDENEFTKVLECLEKVGIDVLIPEDSLNECLSELNSLVGLEAVKNEVTSIINLLKVQKMRLESGLTEIPMSLHMVFTGNPGTGKTTVARLLAKIYYQLGVLSTGQLIETDRSGLVAGYVGQTALKTKDVVTQAIGGILFIDEAYTLTGSDSLNDFGQEAVDTILKMMEDNRDNLIVIVAGYPEQMDRFINSNPGLKSRFNKFIFFDDYNAGQLFDIFNGFCKKSGLKMDAPASDHMASYFKNMAESKSNNFANARDVRNVFERTLINQANRLVSTNKDSVQELTSIMLCDVENLA